MTGPASSVPSTRAARRRLGTGSSGWLRLLAGCFAVAAGVLLFAQGAAIRSVEALIVAWVARAWTSTLAVQDVVVLGVNTSDVRALRITWQCTAGLLLLPSCLLLALSMLSARTKVAKALGAFAAAVLIVVGVNQVRMLMISFSWMQWDDTGLFVTHILIGSIMSIVAVVVGLGLQLRLSLGGGPRPAPGAAASRSAAGSAASARSARRGAGAARGGPV